MSKWSTVALILIWVNGYVVYCYINSCLSEWVSEQVSEWVSEWVGEWAVVQGSWQSVCEGWGLLTAICQEEGAVKGSPGVVLFGH